MSTERTKQIIEENNITMRVNSSEASTNGGTEYNVTLFYQGRQITMSHYHEGPAYRDGPHIEYVLSAFLDDAASIENNPTESDWYDEYPSLEGQYHQVYRQTEKLRQFLGDNYESFLWEAL